VLGLQLTAGAVLAAAPANDDIANPQLITFTSRIVELSVDMSEATTQAGEPVCADIEDQGLNQSVWYRLDFDFPTGAAIEIDGPEHSVTAGVFGPFDPGDMPTLVDGLEARSCIYGTGPDSALHEGYDPGAYLVQLTTASESGVVPTIIFTEELVTVPIWWAPTAVTLPDGVPIDFTFGWFACSSGLAELAPSAIDLRLAMWRDGEEVMGLSPEDAAGLWYGPEPDTSLVDQCRGKVAVGATIRWSWYVDNLTTGDYELVLSAWANRTFTDGTAGDHGVIRYAPGTSFAFGTIDISVTGS
jgi:hypothetical protein